MVGFDLDLTLIDPRPGVIACMELLSAETGRDIDARLVASRLGPPLEVELANWFSATDVPRVADRYRALYSEHAVPVTTALPGAAGAVDAVRTAGSRAVVITAKWETTARLTLDHLGIVVDGVVGWRWGPQKAETLRTLGAWCYVGDHESDVLAAREAGAVAVAVATGPCTRDQLSRFAGTVVLDSLAEFPAWYCGAIRGEGQPAAPARVANAPRTSTHPSS
ncbi:MAG TPA: HAD hydrolase-like protein [Mycobacteriales bacterium]|nr:HAD hydrolase-like protein [Mycobacteriales bacterium]